MKAAYKTLALLTVFLMSFALARSLSHADVPKVTVEGGEWFVVANSEPDNATSLGITAGHWGQAWNVTALPIVNATVLTFTVIQDYGLPNQSTIRTATTTLTGGGSWTVYLDLGSSSISEPEYTDVSWTAT